MTKYDVIIVGSGPSGATAARWCAKYGLSTLVLDKAQFPRDKPCGGAVSMKAIKELDFKIDEIVQQVYWEGQFFRPKGDSFFIKSSSPLAVGVLRTDFDFLLVQKAKSEGISFKEKERIENVVQSESGVSVSCTGGFNATGEVLVAADGVNSLVAKQVGIREKWCPDEVGLACVWESKIGKSVLEKLGFEALEFYLGFTPAGYGWIFPKGDWLSVGAGSILKELHSSRDMIIDFIQKTKKLHSLKISNLNWHLLPLGGRKRQICKQRVLLVGDAAGLVDPLIGEGIPYAISSGKKAAISVKQALETGEPEQSSTIYSGLCKTLLTDLRYAHLLSTKIYNHPDLFLSPFKSDEKLCAMLAELIKGNKSYKEFTTDAIRRIPISIGKKLVDKLMMYTAL
jgi:geranylgeranyl reductase family protein